MDKSQNKIKISVRVTPNQDFEIKNIADELNVDKSKVVRAALQYFIDDYYKTH